MRSRASLVRELADGLRPVRRTLSPRSLSLLWLIGAWVFVGAVTLATGAMRPGVLSQLAASPRFLVEIALGLLAGVAAIRAAAELGVPDVLPPWRRAAPALLLMAGWLSVYVYGLWNPALEPSMLGKREGCYLEVLGFAAPPLVAALWLIRRAAPLARVWTGAIAGAAAAAIPGLMMQLVCMYEPAHILSYHLAPIAFAALLGGLAGPAAFRRL